MHQVNKGILLGLGILFGILVIALVSLNSISKPNKVVNTASPLTKITNEAGPSAASDQNIKEITISAKEYSFTPASIEINKGEAVTLTLKNDGTMPHNLLIEQLRVTTKTIPSGEKDSITFTPDATGSYTFYCSVGNHRKLGMEGVIKVN